MSYLLANIPPTEVYIRKEFLLDFQKDEHGNLMGVGEYESAHWITTKSIPNQALYFESFLHDFGALYDKLPIHAFVWRTDVNHDELYPLDWLQLWDCFSYNIAVIKKERLRNARCEVMMKDKTLAPGYYLFTVDSCGSDPGEADVSWAETPNEHKSFNIIKLDNGQFAAQPNNRVLWKHQSQTPSTELQRPYFRYSTKYWFCENQDRWSAAGTTKFNYE
tara:strand:- start:22793 stop:23449 length:657 start_codon:yes stop_codon:yes gene_type:complete